MTFEAIKQCAINNDLEGLNRIITGPAFTVSIDVRKTGNCTLTPAGELAREGNLVAVEFLRQHGASVNLIARGFAKGGHTAEVARCITANTYCIAYGYALAGNVMQADRYRTEFGAPVDTIASGFAYGGHVEEADRYRIEFGASVDSIAKGFAMSGHVADADRYRREYQANINAIARGFAEDGHLSQAERYRNEFDASVDVLATGFAAGFHRAEAQKYQEMRANHPTGQGQNQEIIANQPAAPQNKPVTAESLLKDYIDTFTTRPIAIRNNFKYPEKFFCPILQAPPPVPVRIMGHGPFDYHAVMLIQETINKPGKRPHPLLQGVLFEMRDIAPDFGTRDALNEIALASSTSKAVPRDAQVTFAHNQDGRPVPNIESEMAATSIQNSI